MFDRKEYGRQYYLKNKEECDKRNRENYIKNKPFYRARVKKYRRLLKRKILLHYTNGEIKCNICGFLDERALCIDHINNGGGIERKELGYGQMFYESIIKRNYPKDYQILCANCNMIKEMKRRKI